MADFLRHLNERVLVCEGAMGTNIQIHAPAVDDYWGKDAASSWCCPRPGVLVMVKGNVHDPSKNLVDVILSIHDYKVVNLGIKQPADVIVKTPRSTKRTRSVSADCP